MKRTLAVCIAIAVLATLQCHEKSPNFSLIIPLNGTLRTSSGTSPAEVSSQHQFSSFHKRKMLTLKGNETIRYDSNGWNTSKGTLEFWMKLESSPVQPSIITSLTHGNNFLLQAVSSEKTIRLYYSDSGMSVNTQTEQIFLRPGTWAHISFVWNRDRKEPVSVFIDGSHARMIPLQNGYKPAVNNKPGFYLGDSKNSDEFSASLREVSLQSAIRTENQILSSFNAGLKQMQTPINWSAFTLQHFAGKKVAATGASNNEAWTVDTLFAFQNQILLSEGPEYRLTFRVKPLSPLAKSMLRCEVWKLEQNKRVPLASWENSAGDLLDRGKYKRITLNFHATAVTTIGYAFYTYIPSKYSVLLDTIVLESTNGKWKNSRRAEDLQHTVGVWMKDAEASNGRAWTNANTLLYGPYTCIGQPGRYRVSWRIRIADWAPENEPLVVLDIYAHDGFMHAGRRATRSYGKLALSASNFSRRNNWENKSIEFRYDGANLIEFRAHAKLMKPEVVLIDSVEVEWIAPK